MRAVLCYVDQLIVVANSSIDSARALEQLLDWLDQHDCHHLVVGALVVVNGVQRRAEIRTDQFAAAIGTRCRGVVTVPFDPALATAETPLSTSSRVAPGRPMSSWRRWPATASGRPGPAPAHDPNHSSFAGASAVGGMRAGAVMTGPMILRAVTGR